MIQFSQQIVESEVILVRTWMKQKRKEKGMSQQNVATACGITKQYYQAIESNKRQLDLSTSLILGLATAFDMSPVEIVNLESE